MIKTVWSVGRRQQSESIEVALDMELLFKEKSECTYYPISSEHPPNQGEEMSKRLVGGNIGCENSSWNIIRSYSPIEVASGRQFQPEYGDEQADAGRDCQTRLERPNAQAWTGTGKHSFSLLS